jgi:type IV pilus biogenesis protein CpaD/CtpE
MPGRLVLLVVLAALAAACAKKTETPTGTIYQRTCDDGGAGGVVIDGVCL